MISIKVDPISVNRIYAEIENKIDGVKELTTHPKIRIPDQGMTRKNEPASKLRGVEDIGIPPLKTGE
jgi:hypothetical protein